MLEGAVWPAVCNGLISKKAQNMKKITVLTLTLLFLAGTTLTTGCYPRMAGNLLGAAVIATAVVGTAMMIEHHDSHYHHQHCGCERQYHEGRWVYFYGGGWEYYDEGGGVWYRYQPHQHHH
jgi:hypothetical protein